MIYRLRFLPFASDVSRIVGTTSRSSSWVRRPGWFAVAGLFVWAAGFLCPRASAQTWSWIGGSNVVPPVSIADPGPPGVYGTEGSASAKNVPGGRLGAVTWTDANGDFWLFGGAGLDQNATFGSLNDLWKFDPASREWTWMSGSSTIPNYNEGQPGVYGQTGTPGTDTVPGGRTGAFGWSDKQGSLWLFGGAGFDADGKSGDLNDLWKYDIAVESVPSPWLS